MSPAAKIRARQLAATRRQASGLLAAVAAVFVLATVFSAQAGWLSWLQATAAASLAGGLADWFAVTALFRRPLGLPIPHTAIIVEHKDRFGATLGTFVEESFLSPEAVAARLRSAGAISRVAGWLAEPPHAQAVAARSVQLVADGAELLDDEGVHDTLAALARDRLEAIPLAPLAGRALSQAIRDGRHQALLDAALSAAARHLASHSGGIHLRLGATSPWWLPGPLEERVARQVLKRLPATLADMAADRSHPLRHQLDAAIAALAVDLQHSPELRERGEALKADLLGQPQLRAFAAALWSDAKARLREQAASPSSPLQRQLAAGIAHTAERLRGEPELAERAQQGLEAAVETVLSYFRGELAALVSGTIAHWNARETSRRLELLLGPDLQYIRINGTVVGALAGLALHGLSAAL